MTEVFRSPPLLHWDRTLLGLVAQTNEQLLWGLHRLACTAAPGERRPRLVAALAGQWRALQAPAQQRLAACPYLLIDASFDCPERWERLPTPGVCDGRARGGYFDDRAGIALVRRTLTLGWHLARSDRIAARVLVGMDAVSAERIMALRLNELEELAELGPDWIRPRWEQQPQVWRQLLQAADSAAPAALRQLQLRGLQLLAAPCAGHTG